LLLLLIPVLIVWLLFKTPRKISRQNDQIENDVKKLQEEIQVLRVKLAGGSPK